MSIPESLLNRLLDKILTYQQDYELLKSIVLEDSSSTFSL